MFLRRINLFLSSTIQKLEGTSTDTTKTNVPAYSGAAKSSSSGKSEFIKKTALQVINDMVNARLKKPEVDILDDNGQRGQGHIESQEYKLLKSKGIAVVSVGISNLRLNPQIEEAIISRWSASWYDNAAAESKQIKSRQEIAKSYGRDKAFRQYAERLSNDLIRKKPSGIKNTLKTLLLRTRTIIINNDQLRSEMAMEQQVLEDALRWIEAEE